MLAYFSSYTPMHDSLVLSCQNAVSTLCCRLYTSTIVNIGGGSVEWIFEPPIAGDDTDADQALNSYAAVTRTWNGHEFSLGWNSPRDLFSKEEKGSERHNKISPTRLTTLPGDVLIIPSLWWFQSQAKGPANIAVHSKRCGLKDFPTITRHITGSKEISGNVPRDMVESLFECIET